MPDCPTIKVGPAPKGKRGLPSHFMRSPSKQKNAFPQVDLVPKYTFFDISRIWFIRKGALEKKKGGKEIITIVVVGGK